MMDAFGKLEAMKGVATIDKRTDELTRPPVKIGIKEKS